MIAVDRTLEADQFLQKNCKTFTMCPGDTAFKDVSLSLAISVIFSWQKYFILHTDPLLISFLFISYPCIVKKQPFANAF